MSGSPQRAAICARVSTTLQVLGTSLETQLEEGYAYAQRRGWEVVGEYVDGGVSGKYRNRPNLDRLMADCRAGLIDVVIVSKHDRFGRSFRHTVALIGELVDLGVVFVSIAEMIDDTPAGRFQRNMLLSVAEFERERILERTTAGMEATARAGRWPAGPAPYGWRIVKDQAGHSTVVLNDDEVAVWERIAECMIDRRMSSLETARELNACGITRRKGRVWSADAIWKLVRDTTCLSGTWTYRRNDHRQYRQVLGPPITMPIPPVFTPERHEALKAVVKGRGWSRKQVKHPWLLSQLVASPCGGTMWGRVSARGVRNYFCASTIAADGGGGGGCGCYCVHADDLEAGVWDLVTAALSNPELLLSLAEDQAKAAAATVEVGDDDLAVLDRKIARLEKAAGEQLAKALAAGADPNVAAMASASLTEQIEETRQQRKLVASWAADAADRRSRVEILSDLAARSSEALADGGTLAGRRRVLDALGVTVAVTGWEVCGSCGGSGRVTGGKGVMCSDCHGMRRKAQVEVAGIIPAAGTGEAVEPWPVKFATGA